MTMLLLGLMWLMATAPARAEAAPRAETCATCHRGFEGTDGNGNLDATKSRMDLVATAINRAVPDVFASATDFFGGFDARAPEGPVPFTGGRASFAGFATIYLRFLSTSQGAAYVDTINVYTGAFVP